MKWSGRANKQVVEAVVAAFHDSAEKSAQRLSRFTARDWQRSYHWLDASGMALYFLDRVESLHIENALPSSTLETAPRQPRGQPAKKLGDVSGVCLPEPIISEGRPGLRKSQRFLSFARVLSAAGTALPAGL